MEVGDGDKIGSEVSLDESRVGSSIRKECVKSPRGFRTPPSDL